MQDNAEMLEKIKEDFAIKNGISSEEASVQINNTLATLGTSFAEAFKVIGDAVERISNYVKEMCRNWKYRRENEAARGWNVDWDTRRRSLVISNRPRVEVRKIIR